MEQYGTLIAEQPVYQEIDFSGFNLEKLAIGQSLPVLSGPIKKYLITQKRSQTQHTE